MTDTMEPVAAPVVRPSPPMVRRASDEMNEEGAVKTIGAYEAKTHLPRLLEEVAAGETITITKHGRPVAQLVPPPAARRPDVDKLVEEWRAYRKRENITLGGHSIRDMIDEGRM